MTKHTVLLFLALLASPIYNATNAQDNNSTMIFESGSIERQFNFIIYKSSTYDDYKAVKINWLYNLKRVTLDSLNYYKTALSTTDSLLVLALKNITVLDTNLSETQTKLEQVTIEKDSIKLLGIPISKGSYNLILWSIILTLTVITIFVILMFKRSNSITRSTRNDLEETREEFENFRKRAREREEKIVVEYHQEINKYKKQLGKSL